MVFFHAGPTITRWDIRSKTREAVFVRRESIITCMRYAGCAVVQMFMLLASFAGATRSPCNRYNATLTNDGFIDVWSRDWSVLLCRSKARNPPLKQLEWSCDSRALLALGMGNSYYVPSVVTVFGLTSSPLGDAALELVELGSVTANYVRALWMNSRVPAAAPIGSSTPVSLDQQIVCLHNEPTALVVCDTKCTSACYPSSTSCSDA